MSWIQTYTGKRFDPLEPEMLLIKIDDIAHALSNICRFNGHCSRFYSVAEHSCHVCNLVPDEHKLAALLHDAAEAYIGDVAKPFKETDALNKYVEIEDDILKTIAVKFGFKYPFHNDVIAADLVMLAYEGKELMNADLSAWGFPNELIKIVDRGFMNLREMTPDYNYHNYWKNEYRRMFKTYKE